jgi:hypothetical protein
MKLLVFSEREVVALFFCTGMAANGNLTLGQLMKGGFECADAFLSEVKRRRKKKSKRG